MPVTIIVGAQWGDEGKGRIADWLAEKSDIVARFSGGDNAGHTVRVGDDTYKLHLVPCGVIHPNARCVMGGGMVVNPVKLADELKDLGKRGVDISPGRITLAENAHLITPGHIALDGADEAMRGQTAIGTTKRGIGPAYTDKAARTGIRAGAMRRPDDFVEQVGQRIEQANRLLTDYYHAPAILPETTVDELHAAAEFLIPYLANVPLLLHEALQEGKSVLCEGAQGTLLDLDHGIYPYVTSSSATAGGALTGLGIGPRWVERVVGVMKAFSTRVGAGPFPTELPGADGDRLRGTGANPWDEFGTTTGRPRRCGWLDMVVVRYAARINGLTDLVITKLDILSGFDAPKIANGYVFEGRPMPEVPADYDTWLGCAPVYETLPGWPEDIMGVKSMGDLPGAARGYVSRVEAISGVPVSIVTVGPGREQTIER